MTPEALGDYCRQVEQHLTRVNGGHLVRIAGPAFDLVRAWADAGIPLTVVFRGIEQKAERHRLGASRRPLRIEFCDDDVRELYDDWRRAVGVASSESAAESPIDAVVDADASPRRPSLSKHLTRAVDRLSRVAGRMDLPEAIRDVAVRVLSELTTIREQAASARGKARDDVLSRLETLDRRLLDDVRQSLPGKDLQSVATAAEVELAAYRNRLAPEAWTHAVEATADRLLRDRYGLPVLTLAD